METNHDHESFFLYVDMWDPHEPFDCPWYDHARYADPGYEGDQITYPQYGRPTYMTEAEHRNVRALYAGQVTLVDRWVGHFLDMAERLGLFKDTLIIWTTDHGHLFGEHNLQGKPGAEFGRLYEITTRIPLLVYHPDGLGTGHIPPWVISHVKGLGRVELQGLERMRIDLGGGLAHKITRRQDRSLKEPFQPQEADFRFTEDPLGVADEAQGIAFLHTFF